jgi:tetratricopeptide (TPR) repeat protein
MAKLLFLEIVVLVMLSVAPVTFPANAAVPTNEQHVLRSTVEAEKLLNAGKFEEALAMLDSLAAEQPKPVGLDRLRGMVFYEQGRMAQAAEAFGLAAEQDHGDREALQMQGVALFRLGKAAEAIPLLEKAQGFVARTNVDSHYVLGLSYIDTARYDDARKAFASQYGFPPESPASYMLAAKMFFQRNHLPTAESFVTKALQLAPNLPMAHLLLGRVKTAQSNFQEAVTEFQKELEINPLFGEAYERLGDAYLRQRDYAKAQDALDESILLEPNSAAPFILLGKVLLKQQNPVMARMYLERAVAMDPQNAMVHTLLGQTYRSLGLADKASHEFRTVEQIGSANEPESNTAK